MNSTKVCTLGVPPLQTNGGQQITTMISYRGVIRIAMRSDSPRAIRFRDWAEEVLYGLMVGAGTDTHAVRLLIENGLKQIGTANDQAAKKACDLILSLRTGEPTTVATVQSSDRRNRGYLTAIEWVRQYHPRYLFPSMNYGGRFEGYTAKEFFTERGHWPEHDESTRVYGWVYSKTRDLRFLETCLVEFLKDQLARAILQGKAGSPKAITAGEEM